MAEEGPFEGDEAQRQAAQRRGEAPMPYCPGRQPDHARVRELAVQLRAQRYPRK